MDESLLIQERVEVVAAYKKSGEVGRLCFPAKMRFRGQEIRFTELCLRHPTSQGTRMIHVFDMSDGINDYRLEFDAEGLTWTLVTVMEGHHGARD